jgi:hypothetical protein
MSAIAIGAIMIASGSAQKLAGTVALGCPAGDVLEIGSEP